MTVINPFNWRTNPRQVDTSDLERETRLKTIASKRIEARRAAGDPNIDIKGTSRRAGEILRTRKSLPVEGREAGQAATEKRRAASKAAI